MKAPQYNSSLRKRFLAFAAALVLLFALVFELYPRSSQIIDLSTDSGLSRMLRYDDAQVYIFGEIHRKVEYQKFRNVLFKYLVEKKGVRVLLMEHGYASGFIENETIQNRMTFPMRSISLRYPKRTTNYSGGCRNSTETDRTMIRSPSLAQTSRIRLRCSAPSASIF